MKRIIAFLILLIGMISGTGYAIDVGDLRQNSNDVNRFTALFAEADAQFNIVYAVELKEFRVATAQVLFYAPNVTRIRKQSLHIGDKVYLRKDKPSIKNRYGRLPRDGLRNTEENS